MDLSWLTIIVLGFLAYNWYNSAKKSQTIKTSTPKRIKKTNIFSNIEEKIAEAERGAEWAKGRLQDEDDMLRMNSPRFIDYLDQFDAMETNYMKLKFRHKNNPEKLLEFATDWDSFATSLNDLRVARIMLDLDYSPSAVDTFADRAKEPAIITEEVSSKFKMLLGHDFQEMPADYDERLKIAKRSGISLEENSWHDLYMDSNNFHKFLEKKREADKANKAKSKESKKTS